MTASREQALEARTRSLMLAARTYLTHRFKRPRTGELLREELAALETWLRAHPAETPEPLPEPDLVPAPDDPLEGRDYSGAVPSTNPPAPDAWKVRAPYAED